MPWSVRIAGLAAAQMRPWGQYRCSDRNSRSNRLTPIERRYGEV